MQLVTLFHLSPLPITPVCTYYSYLLSLSTYPIATYATPIVAVPILNEYLRPSLGS